MVALTEPPQTTSARTLWPGAVFMKNQALLVVGVPFSAAFESPTSVTWPSAEA